MYQQLTLGVLSAVLLWWINQDTEQFYTHFTPVMFICSCFAITNGFRDYPYNDQLSLSLQLIAGINVFFIKGVVMIFLFHGKSQWDLEQDFLPKVSVAIVILTLLSQYVIDTRIWKKTMNTPWFYFIVHVIDRIAQAGAPIYLFQHANKFSFNDELLLLFFLAEIGAITHFFIQRDLGVKLTESLKSLTISIVVNAIAYFVPYYTAKYNPQLDMVKTVTIGMGVFEVFYQLAFYKTDEKKKIKNE